MRTRYLAFCVFIATRALFATTFYVAEPEGSFGADIDPMSLKELVKSAVTELGHQISLSADQAELTLHVKILKLGNARLLKIEKRQKTIPKYASQLKADEPEEMDVVVKRLVRAVIDQVRVSDDARVDDVTAAEENQRRRLKPIRKVGFLGGGLAFLGNLGAKGPAYYFFLGGGWDFGSMIFGLRTDLALDIDAPDQATAIFADATVGLRYFPLDTETSPFFGANLGYGIAKEAGLAGIGGGISLGAEGGILLFRTRAVNIEVSARVAWMLDTRFSTPMLGALRLGAIY